MKIAHGNSAVTYERDHASSVEYTLADTDIDCAVVRINGRYPEAGYGRNRISKEMCYCLSGGGKMFLRGCGPTEFSKGDVILILPGDTYFFEADCDFVVSCTPPWTMGQFENVL
ncbi:MAG: hypothetical protein LBT92_04240 [Rickettsiales bacterium]|jgi:hypothetical protein|nr:hypothetical protein [Rickettsiales bacterium]